MSNLIFETLEKRWREAFNEYGRLKQKIEALVVDHQWTSGEYYNLRPLFFERYPGRGKILKEAPQDARMMPHAYGFDADDQMMLHRSYHPLYEPTETFYSYQPNFVEAITYYAHSSKKWLVAAVEHYIYDGDRLLEYAEFRLNGYGPEGPTSPDAILKLRHHDSGGILRNREEYIYEGERLIKIKRYHRGLTVTPLVAEQNIFYNEQGKVERIEEVREDGRYTLYQKMKRGESLKTLAEAAKTQLLTDIPRLLKAQNFKEPLYCLILSYQGGVDYFPPSLIVGLESWRQNAAEPFDVWFPLLHHRSAFLEVTYLQDIVDTCQPLEHAIHSQQADRFARQSLIELAQALTHLDWSGIVPVTADFVVFPLDAELDEVQKILPKIVSTEQIKTWKKAGWL